MRSRFVVYGLMCSIVPMVASAHIRMTDPPPRSNDDAVKTGPCGSYAKGAAPQKVFTSGQQIKVDLLETIDHIGCFQLAVSTDDQTFTLLAQKTDPNDAASIPDRATGGPRDITGTLPAGLVCDNCTIQIRQIMLDSQPVKTCTDNQDPSTAPTYFSCADVKIEATVVESDAGAVLPSDAGVADASAPSGPTGTVARDAGATPSTSPGSSGRGEFGSDDQGGCNATQSGTGSAAVLLGLLALVWRRARTS